MFLMSMRFAVWNILNSRVRLRTFFIGSLTKGSTFMILYTRRIIFFVKLSAKQTIRNIAVTASCTTKPTTINADDQKFVNAVWK